MSNANVPFLIKINTDLLVGGLIRNSDPKVEAQRATVVLAVCKALGDANSGNAAAAAADLQAAFESNPAAIDPAKAAEIQVAVGWVASQASALNLLAGSTLLGTLQTEYVNAVITEASALAVKYGGTPPSA